MPQKILPFIAPGTTVISNLISVCCEDDQWTYFHGGYPIFTHRADDTKMFSLITAQMVVANTCRQVDVIKAFGVSKRSVIRAVKKFREEGSEGFFKPRKKRSGGPVLTPAVLSQAQSLLDEGYSRQDTAEELGVKRDTLRKAINDGRLIERYHSTEKKILQQSHRETKRTPKQLN